MEQKIQDNYGSTFFRRVANFLAEELNGRIIDYEYEFNGAKKNREVNFQLENRNIDFVIKVTLFYYFGSPYSLERPNTTITLQNEDEDFYITDEFQSDISKDIGLYMHFLRDEVERIVKEDFAQHKGDYEKTGIMVGDLLKISRGTGRPRSYGGLKDYKKIHEKILKMMEPKPKKASSRILKYVSSKIANFYRDKAYDMIFDLIDKNKDFYNSKNRFDVLEMKTMNRFMLDEQEVDKVIHEVVEDNFPELLDYMVQA